MISAILLILITLFIPPIGVLMIAGCGADFCINVLLTILGYLPGHIHAFYIEYVYYKRREDARKGLYDPHPAAGVYSDRVQRGGLSVQAQPPPPPPPPAQQGTYAAPAPHAPQQGGQQGYGTV